MNRPDLLKISKPSRYMGGEINSVVKDPGEVRLKFALAFPDAYEVGMSHLGFQILYHLLNADPLIAGERFFHPWKDMEDHLRRHSLPLASLESSIPLDQFDIVGFSLQYELNYPGVLNMLQLGGIPLRAADRGTGHPLIIGGGPCAMNPEPLADFFDAFVLGDGEEVVLEICRETLASREQREAREALLERLSRLEGVYVPSFFQVCYDSAGKIREIRPLRRGYPAVSRRILPDLNRGAFPSRPLLPFMEVIHDRLNIEIARGCTRGCRFCQAGMIYRPLRERSPDRILDLVEEGLGNTGYDEVSLLSLSSGDYSCLEPLLSAMMERHREQQVAVSLPSLRIETLTSAMIRQIQQVRKTGFTLAPEAGSERLRRVINKGNTEEALLSTIQAVFSAGWRLVKLYFMIGLPTEKMEDLRGIAALCRRALAAARSSGGGQINISLSTFIPKAHTPFQWEAQCLPEEVRERQRLLRQDLPRNGLHLKWTDPRLSWLEGILARGDRRLGRVLEIARELGSRLDGWSEEFQFSRWEEAFSRAGVDPIPYLRRRELDEALPWDHLDSRVNKSFLQEELRRAVEALPTPDCRGQVCSRCGVCREREIRNRPAEEIRLSGAPLLPKGAAFPPRRFRLTYTKLGPARLLGHLELSRAMIRAFSRARIPVAFSQGYHPLPRISFGPPLPVGYESRAEFLDFQSRGKVSPEEAASRLNGTLPEGIKILDIQEISLKCPSIFDNLSKVFYEVSFPDLGSLELESLERFRQEETFPIFWIRKGKTVDLKKVVQTLSLAGPRRVEISLPAEGSPRPEEVLERIFAWPEGERPACSILKTQVQFKDTHHVQRDLDQHQFR